MTSLSLSSKDGHNKGQKQYGPNRSRRYKKRWQKYTEELYKKDLNDSDSHDGVITHLEPDILECKVKWAFRSITMNKVEVMEFQWSSFKSWKMMLQKCCTQYATNLENSAVATGLEKFSFQSQRK